MQRPIEDPLIPENDKANSIQQGFLCLATEHRLYLMIIKLVSMSMCVLYISRVYLFINFYVQDEYRITDFGASNPSATPDGRQFMLLTSKNISVPPMTYCVITIVDAYSRA